MRHGAPKWRARRDRRTRDGGKRFSPGFTGTCQKTSPENPRSATLNAFPRVSHVSGSSWPAQPYTVGESAGWTPLDDAPSVTIPSPGSAARNAPTSTANRALSPPAPESRTKKLHVTVCLHTCLRVFTYCTRTGFLYPILVPILVPFCQFLVLWFSVIVRVFLSYITRDRFSYTIHFPTPPPRQNTTPIELRP